MPWTHSTNWSRSPRSPCVGNRTRRIAIPATSAIASAAIRTGSGRFVAGVAAASTDIRSDAAGRPVPLGVAVDVAELRHRDAIRPRGVRHLPCAVEKALDLALVEADAHDLLLELVRDVRELRDHADVSRKIGERSTRQVVDAAEIVPPGIREVLVERDDARVVRARHDPAAAFLEHPDADIAAELMIDMTTDAERQIDLLRLEPRDLPAEDLDRSVIVDARRAEQLVVALIAAEDGVRQVEEDDRRLREVREALVLEAPARHQIAGCCGIDHIVGMECALGREVVRDRLIGQRFVPDAGAPIPRRALPEALGRLVGVGLGGVETLRFGGPRRNERGGRPVGGDVRPVEGFGIGPERLRTETERLALVRREVVGRPIPREDGDDRHGLTTLAEAGEEAAARERDVVRMRRDEDVGHGGPSIPSGQPAHPPAPISGTKTQYPWVRSCHSSPWRVTTVRIWRSCGPTGITSRAPSASCSRNSWGIAGAPAVTMIPSHGAPASSPVLPSARRTVTSPARSSAASRSRAGSIKLDWRSSDVTCAPSQARIAAWYPDPVPISRIRSPGRTSRSSVIRATMNGWLMVWPASIGRASSA